MGPGSGGALPSTGAEMLADPALGPDRRQRPAGPPHPQKSWCPSPTSPGNSRMLPCITRPRSCGEYRAPDGADTRCGPACGVAVRKGSLGCGRPRAGPACHLQDRPPTRPLSAGDPQREPRSPSWASARLGLPAAPASRPARRRRTLARLARTCWERGMSGAAIFPRTRAPSAGGEWGGAARAHWCEGRCARSRAQGRAGPKRGGSRSAELKGRGRGRGRARLALAERGGSWEVRGPGTFAEFLLHSFTTSSRISLLLCQGPLALQVPADSGPSARDAVAIPVRLAKRILTLPNKAPCSYDRVCVSVCVCTHHPSQQGALSQDRVCVSICVYTPPFPTTVPRIGVCMCVCTPPFPTRRPVPG